MEDRKVPVIRKKRTRPGSSKKVLLLLLLFFISIFTILFFHSSLSKVSSVQIEGNRFIATGEIRQTAVSLRETPFSG